MIYLKLFYDFLMVGLFSFGGGYAAVPLIKALVENYDVINDEMLANFIAISESTPGPIAINLATFVGAEIAGMIGALIATFAVVLPAFVIIIVFTIFFAKIFEYDCVKFVFSVIRPCIFGVILTVGLEMLYVLREIKAIIIAVLILFILLFYDKILHKKITTIKLIVFGAILGIAINCFL